MESSKESLTSPGGERLVKTVENNTEKVKHLTKMFETTSNHMSKLQKDFEKLPMKYCNITDFNNKNK